MAAAIEAHGLRRVFDQTVAVAGVDLRIDEGEIYGFLGPNGAGKSTCVRMFCTLLLPTDGRACIAGYDVTREPEQVRLHIGVALQEAALDARQTGVEILRLQARLYGLRGHQVDRRIAELTDLIDIGDAIDRRVATYSGGMRRRLDLAASLVHDPEVVFLDEPTTGLDPVSRAKVWEEVQRLNAELGTTIFLTTQYLEEADALARRVGIIDRGRIVAEGTPSELKRKVGTDVIVVRVDDDREAVCRTLEGIPGVESIEAHADEVLVHTADGSTTVGPVAIGLERSGLPVGGLTLRTPTLDDVFLELTGEHIHEEDVE